MTKDLIFTTLSIAAIITVICVVMNNFFHKKYAALVTAGQADFKNAITKGQADIAAGLARIEKLLGNSATASSVAQSASAALEPAAAPLKSFVPVKSAVVGTIAPVPAGTPVGFPAVAPTSWIETKLDSSDPANPNRALLMGANSSVPPLVANALNTGNPTAVQYALANLLEPKSDGNATTTTRAGRLFDASAAGAFLAPSFFALLTTPAQQALLAAIDAMYQATPAALGGAAGLAQILASLGAPAAA